MKTRLLGAMICLAMATPASAAGDDEARSYAMAFCALRGVDMGMALMSLVTPSLGDEIKAAMAKNAALQAEKPDEKPPLGDGVPWQSHPDHAPVCEPGSVVAEGGATIVEVKYGFPDTPAANWSDRLVLTPGDGGVLVIDDIRYGASGEDGLRKALAGAFAP